MSIQRNTTRWLLAFSFAALTMSPVILLAQEGVKIMVKQLETITSATAVTRIQGISDVLDGLNHGNEVRLKIIYGDDDSSIWAGKLEQWLVSLGVESRRIRKQTGVLAAGELMLELQDR